MLEPDKFSQPKGTDNTKEGQEARLARLKKNKRERELSGFAEKLRPLEQQRFHLDPYESGIEELTVFLQSLDDIIRGLLSLDPFGENKALKKECEEVLLLLGNRDLNQLKKYSDLIGKLSLFFFENGISSKLQMP